MLHNAALRLESAETGADMSDRLSIPVRHAGVSEPQRQPQPRFSSAAVSEPLVYIVNEPAPPSVQVALSPPSPAPPRWKAWHGFVAGLSLMTLLMAGSFVIWQSLSSDSLEEALLTHVAPLPAPLAAKSIDELRKQTSDAGLGRLEQSVQAKLNRLRDQITELVEVDGLIGRFVSEQARSEQLGNDLIAATEELTQKKRARALIIDTHERFQQELVVAEGERDSIVKQLNRLINEAHAKEAVEQRTQDLKIADKALGDAESLASISRSIHEGNEQLSVQHDLINRQRKALQQIDAELLTAHQLMKRWEETLQRVSDVTGSINGEEVQEGGLQERLRTAILSRVSAEKEELTAKSHHKTLISTADSIRQAVASIAAHLPSDRGDCPLCGEEHGAVSLHQRITKSLEAIDPKIVDAERRVKIATDALRECTEAVTHAEAELKACKKRITELKSQQASLATDINDIKMNALSDGDTVLLAKESIRCRENANASANLQLDEKQHNLALPPTPESLELTKNAYDSAVRTLDSARQGRSKASTSLEQTTAALAAITADAPPSKTLVELSLAKNKNANQLIELSAKAAAEQLALDRQQVQLTDVMNRVSDLEKQLTDVQARLATVRSSWRQLSFSGDPTVEVASSREAQLQSSVTDLSRHSEQLQNIKIEIGAWSKLEQKRLAQGLLDRRRGELSEGEFSANIRQRIEKEQSAQTQLSQLSEAMETLNRHLSTEIANVQKHVLAVVPRWQALLKRVVREQRFTGTNLDFRSIYRKEHAEVSVPLHGKLVPVPAIASEAQLTDLQLTFLLSMAMDHQWSSWRCLLLDDPTQHHDLVHAASVFDLLRDYIVDHDFQVVIATHDALQARYFMRKLQNDGIEARLWSLVPTPEGVKAVENTWPGKI
ncbi:ImpA domain-containing protein [Yersinia similis]|nr:ImpA domain-containing protein [Yersinia similis]